MSMNSKPQVAAMQFSSVRLLTVFELNLKVLLSSPVDVGYWTSRLQYVILYGKTNQVYSPFYLSNK